MDILKIFFLSFFIPEDCKKAVLSWRWKGAIMFALICAISTIGVTAGAFKTLENIYDNTLSKAKAELKNVKIQDGKIVTPNGTDVFLKNLDGSVFAVASQNYIDANKTKGLLFSLEKDRITLYTPDGGETFFSAKDYKPLIGGNGKTADALIPDKNMLLYVFLPLISAFFAFGMNFAYVAMMSAACHLLSRTMYPKLTFWQSVKLAIIAIAPSSIIDFVFATFLGQPILGFVYALISGGVAFYLLKKFAYHTEI